ncbi:alpha/beta hydrolase [Rhodococcus gannanensis]|uniref:Alpha/beta hydrolase n=1 Tax=Rhodococcus gannanensis TaxID=1960308 RepID=A0ABW4PDM2_9NOCA
MHTIGRWLTGAALAALLSTSTGVAPAAAVTRMPLPFVGSSAAQSGTDTEVTFDSDGLTFHASLRTPVHSRPGVAVLLLPGSGPTDRNGSQTGLKADTMRRIADDLAAQGITSLRFDKLGSGATGLAGLSPDRLPEYGFTSQADHAQAAAELLADRTGVPVDRLAVVGHSEGALTALELTARGIAHGGLALLAPLPIRYLDLLTAQLNTQLDAAVRSGQLPISDADAARTTLRESIESLRQTGRLPANPDPLLASIGLVHANARFLAEADALDPPALAAAIGDGTHVLVTCSDKDLNISCDQVGALRDALDHTELRFAHLANASHLLDELGPFPPSRIDPLVPLPESTEFAGVLHEWALGLTG